MGPKWWEENKLSCPWCDYVEDDDKKDPKYICNGKTDAFEYSECNIENCPFYHWIKIIFN
jgi:hypothetical protein